MSTRSVKAQGVIGEIVVFSLTIFLSLAIFFLLSGTDATEFQETAEGSVEQNMDSIRQRASLTVMLNDNVWRAHGVDERYDDLKAVELTSYYLSTDDEIRIANESYGRQQVKADLETYYSYKMRQHFLNVPEASDHALNITYNERHIEVENIDDRGGSWSSIEVPLQLSGNRTGKIQMWVKGSGGVFQVE
ncbi:MAG: hypothetical protein ACLFTA_02065 [Candidatus Nanohaloarchaea archaeon]